MPPRARGRGRGKDGTPAADVSDPRPASGARKAGWMERMLGLMEKAKELQDVGREDVAVAMVYSRSDGVGGPGYWPSEDKAREVVGLLFELPEAERVTEDHANYVTGLRDAQRSKLDKVREGGIAAALGPWERDLDGKPLEALQELLASIEVSQKAARSRIRERQPHPDESVAGEKDASDEVQGTQKQPQGADEVQETQKQPPGDDDDDAAWMKRLVEDLKEKPEPASGSAAPYDAGMIEYINVGGYVMERDSYDFIRFDLGMFPPSLEPESPDYDELLRLWSWEWDDSSIPQSAPRK
ncbi:unnamed protein product [Alopecurus aequalis]